jgi:DNA-binding transcriptional ArsR family regulator
MSQPAISKHLKVLERAGLISRGREAQRRPRRLEPRPLAEATRWLADYRRHWEATFRELDRVLDELKALETGRKSEPERSRTARRPASHRSRIRPERSPKKPPARKGRKP